MPFCDMKRSGNLLEGKREGGRGREGEGGKEGGREERSTYNITVCTVGIPYKISPLIMKRRG